MINVFNFLFQQRQCAFKTFLFLHIDVRHSAEQINPNSGNSDENNVCSQNLLS